MGAEEVEKILIYRLWEVERDLSETKSFNVVSAPNRSRT
jgi:hypothetical protein